MIASWCFSPVWNMPILVNHSSHKYGKEKFETTSTDEPCFLLLTLCPTPTGIMKKNELTHVLQLKSTNLINNSSPETVEVWLLGGSLHYLLLSRPFPFPRPKTKAEWHAIRIPCLHGTKKNISPKVEPVIGSLPILTNRTSTRCQEMMNN